MKKEKLVSLVVCFFVISLLSYSFVLGDIIKTNKANYNTGESVFALSTISSNDKLCRSISEEEVKLYIVKNKESWSEGDSFEDIRKEPVLVPNSRFSSKKIWEDIKTGSYDLIIDCDDNKEYNNVDALFNTGFVVSAKKGVGRVLKGDRKTKDFSWFYDSEEGDLVVEVLEFVLSAEEEDIQLRNLSIEFDFNKNLDIESSEIYVDKNNNGHLDAVDVKIGSRKGIIKERKAVKYDLNYTINKNLKENFLVVLNMKESVLKGKYSFRIVSVFGKGVLSTKTIRFFGLPFQSGILEVLNKKTCLGKLVLEFKPNPVDKNKEVIAKISNLSGCDNKKVSLRTNACYNPLKKEVGFCVLKNEQCEINLTALENRKYYACVDKNNDNDLIDFGEFASADLMFNEKVVPKEILNKSEVEQIPENLSEGLTGGVISESNSESKNEISGTNKKGSLSESDAFLVLLEVTLLLILFVLVLILFKLRIPVSFGEEKGLFEEEEKSKEPEEVEENKETKSKEESDEKRGKE